MVLYIIGLGLGDENDITVRGLKAIKECDLIFLEEYTSILGTPKEKLEELYGKPVQVADRNVVESEAEKIYMSVSTNSFILVILSCSFAVNVLVLSV